MTLYLIGLGLYDEQDVTLRGLEIIKRCDVVYLEYYTSILGVSKEKLEAVYGREIIAAPRDMVEKKAEELFIQRAKDQDVALLVVGDVFGATTHADVLLRAKEANVPVQVVYNASVLNAVGITGLELYKFGKTTSIVFPDDNWYPQTPYDVIKNNQSMGLHTLCLLDIKIAEPSKADLLRGHDSASVAPLPPRFMTIAQALEVLLHIESKRNESVITPKTFVVGVARLGHPDMNIIAGTCEQLAKMDFGEPLHSLIVPGSLHHIEEEMLQSYAAKEK
jgi:diphthine synthase